MTHTHINWGASGEAVYERTYQRTKPDGTREIWPETVERVVDGNLSLVPSHHIEPGERDSLISFMTDFKVLPAGRHLWASGVKGRQYLFNCHVSGWGSTLSDHAKFTFLRLMEGGGVGANYSSRFVNQYEVLTGNLSLHIVCDSSHPDYAAMKEAGLLSTKFVSDWDGAYQVEDSREGWADALGDLLDTFARSDVAHSDRVYDVSNVRGAGSKLKTFGGTASGPAPFAIMMHKVTDILNETSDHRTVTPMEAMAIDHAIAECVVSGGNRRSARMSILHWQDPHIHEFINCKADTGYHWSTNISVEIDDDFFAAIEKSEAGASLVLNAVSRGMLSNGEPGFWNSSLSNVGEPNEVICTNPCGEIALQEWENCNLGHINLEAFARDSSYHDLFEAHRLMARFLLRATYGDVNDPKQADILALNRRIGVGHLGVQAFLALNRVRYSEAPEEEWFISLLNACRHEVRQSARAYAFSLRIPEPVKVTTVAPTGSIAKLPGTTEGIHPIYARYFIRRMRFSTIDPRQKETLARYEAEGYHVEPCQYSANTAVVSFPTKERLVADVEALGYSASIVESADEISVRDMLSFQQMYQTHYADNAVSFTVNVPENSLYPDELAGILWDYLPYLKGSTVMVDGTRPQAPYERITEAEYFAATMKSVADSLDEECSTGACPVR